MLKKHIKTVKSKNLSYCRDSNILGRGSVQDTFSSCKSSLTKSDMLPEHLIKNADLRPAHASRNDLMIKKRSILISEPGGVAKTSSIRAMCRNLKCTLIETNASERRLAYQIRKCLQMAFKNKFIGKNPQEVRCVILMDERIYQIVK